MLLQQVMARAHMQHVLQPLLLHLAMAAKSKAAGRTGYWVQQMQQMGWAACRRLVAAIEQGGQQRQHITGSSSSSSKRSRRGWKWRCLLLQRVLHS
jgi:hypothetical protein